MGGLGILIYPEHLGGFRKESAFAQRNANDISTQLHSSPEEMKWVK